MRLTIVVVVVLFGLLFDGAPCGAADVALTSVGQNSDIISAQALFKSLAVEVDVANLMTAKDLKDQKILVAIVGASSKGLNAADTNAENEAKRAVALFEAAVGRGMKVLVMCIGGVKSRGRLSDFFIELSVPHADALIFTEASNADALFDTLTEGLDIWKRAAPSVKSVKEPLKFILRHWKIIQHIS